MTPVAEQQYLDILRNIHDHGSWRPVKQVSKTTEQPVTAKTVTGLQLRFLPEDGMPLTTLRNMRGGFYLFIGEMLWILSGHTDVASLHKYDVHYWDDWCTPEKCAWYNLPVGEFGRTYGAQWRSFNAGGPEPVDQIKRLFSQIAKNPYDRSLIVNPWNPYDIDHLVVKPCHGQFRLLLLNDRWDMIVTQRSSDVPVGLPSNLVMYKFLQQLVAMKTGYPEGDFIYYLQDAHYYSDQERGVEALMERAPKPFPKAIIDPILVTVLDMMLDGQDDPLSDPGVNPDHKPYNQLLKDWVRLEGYDPHPALAKELLPVDV